MIAERKSRKGRTFYGCANYPACDFVSWDRVARRAVRRLRRLRDREAQARRCGGVHLPHRQDARHGSGHEGATPRTKPSWSRCDRVSAPDVDGHRRRSRRAAKRPGRRRGAGRRVVLYEMRPHKRGPAHHTDAAGRAGLLQLAARRGAGERGRPAQGRTGPARLADRHLGARTPRCRPAARSRSTASASARWSNRAARRAAQRRDPARGSDARSRATRPVDRRLRPAALRAAGRRDRRAAPAGGCTTTTPPRRSSRWTRST